METSLAAGFLVLLDLMVLVSVSSSSSQENTGTSAVISSHSASASILIESFKLYNIPLNVALWPVITGDYVRVILLA